MHRIKMGKHWVGEDDPVYFIADISANHDGDLGRAKELIHLSAEAGAHAAKFQNFRAEKIVSKHGFDSMGSQMSHQSKWKKSVFEVYKGASIPFEWTPVLKAECDKVGIDYFSSPYDFEAVDMLDPYVEIYKIGSGDITWPQILEKMASKHKPLLLATGASTLADVQRAVDTVLKINPDLVLMQCNTNYTGSLENFKYIQLNVLKTYRTMYPEMVLGLSDHTPGHTTALGAVALGARAIEKHFTDDTRREGPDHPFSMDPKSWKEMCYRTQELQAALGGAVKRVEENEKQTVVVQRRSLRAAVTLKAGDVIRPEHLVSLRPCPKDALEPWHTTEVLGRKARHEVKEGEIVRWIDLE